MLITKSQKKLNMLTLLHFKGETFNVSQKKQITNPTLYSSNTKQMLSIYACFMAIKRCFELQKKL